MKIAYNPITVAPLSVAPSNNDITFDLSGQAIYARGVKFDGRTPIVFKKYSSTTDGYDGLVPAPSYNSDSKNRFLREDGLWEPLATTRLYIGNSGKESNAATTNGDTYIKLFNLSTYQFKIEGTGRTLVSTDNKGNIEIHTPTTISWKNITDIPEDFTPSAHIHSTKDITKLTSYSIGDTMLSLTTSDSLNIALGKLEFKVDHACNWIKNVTETDKDDIINKWGEIVNFIDSVKEGTDIIDEFVTRKTNQEIKGIKTFAVSPKFTATGVPFTVTSDTLVENLNALYLEGFNSTTLFGNISNKNNQISIKIGNTTKELTVDYAVTAGTAKDQTARDAASTAQTRANDAYALANTKWKYDEATIKAVVVNLALSANKVSKTLKFTGYSTGSFNGSADITIDIPTPITSVANTTTSGLMSAAMVKKLNGIAENANNYVLSAATSSVLGGVKVGSNITVNSGTISLTKTNVTTALGYTPPTTNTTYTFENGTNGFTVTPSGGTKQTITVTPSISSNVTYSGTLTSSQVAIFDGTTGKIKASGYTIAKSVPSNAKFTDTTYSEGNGISLSGTTFSHADTSTLSGSYGPTANVTGSNGATISIPQITVDGYGHVTAVTNRTYTSVNTTYTLSSFGITATAAELNYTDGVTSNIQTQLNGKANSSHTHSKSEITDFPTSMPASDVSAWAKASSKPNYSWSEIGSKPSFAAVATSGKYSDLLERPTIPTNNNLLTNGAGYITGITKLMVITALGYTPPTTDTTYSFTNKNSTLSWGNKSTIGTVGGVDLTVTMPANPNSWRPIYWAKYSVVLSSSKTITKIAGNHDFFKNYSSTVIPGTGGPGKGHPANFPSGYDINNTIISIIRVSKANSSSDSYYTIPIVYMSDGYLIVQSNNSGTFHLNFLCIG